MIYFKQNVLSALQGMHVLGGWKGREKSLAALLQTEGIFQLQLNVPLWITHAALPETPGNQEYTVSMTNTVHIAVTELEDHSHWLLLFKAKKYAVCSPSQAPL